MSFFSKLFGIGKDSEKEKEKAIEKEVFVDDTDPSENVSNVITIHYGTGFPIDAIYALSERIWKQMVIMTLYVVLIIVIETRVFLLLNQWI